MSASTSSGDSFRRSLLATGGAQGVTLLAQLASLVILARLLTPSDFGIYALAFSVVGVATLLSDAGLSLSAVRVATLPREEKNNIFWLNFLLGSTLLLFLLLLSPHFGNLFDSPNVTTALLALSPVVLASALTAQFRAELSRNHRFAVQAIIDATAQALAIALAILLASLNWSFMALVAQQWAIFGISLIGFFAFSKWLPGRPSRASVAHHMKFGLNTLGVQLINYVSQNIDTMVLGANKSADTIGFYSRAMQVNRMPVQQVGAPLTKVVIPFISKAYHKGNLQQAALSSLRLICYSIAQIVPILFALAYPLVDFLLGTGWGPVAPILQILLVGAFFQALGYVNYWVFVAADLTGQQLKWTIVARTLMILLIILAAPFGAHAVAAAVSVGHFIVWLVLTWKVIPTSGISRSTLLRALLRPVILAFSMGLIVSFVIMNASTLPAFAQLGLGVLTAGLTFGVFMFLRPYRRDIGSIRSGLAS